MVGNTQRKHGVNQNMSIINDVIKLINQRLKCYLIESAMKVSVYFWFYQVFDGWQVLSQSKIV